MREEGKHGQDRRCRVDSNCLLVNEFAGWAGGVRWHGKRMWLSGIALRVNGKDSEHILLRTPPSGLKLRRLKHTKVVHAYTSFLRPRTNVAV